jgi:hypothetical protein
MGGLCSKNGKNNTNFDLKKSYLYDPTITRIFSFHKNWEYDELIRY